jgi:hypothetical protein
LQIQRLGRVDSDFAPFVQHAGVPSVDIYYGKGTYLVNMNWRILFDSLKSCHGASRMVEKSKPVCHITYGGIYHFYSILWHFSGMSRLINESVVYGDVTLM